MNNKIKFYKKLNIDTNTIYDLLFGLFTMFVVFNFMISTLLLIPLFFLLFFKRNNSLFYKKIKNLIFILFIIFMIYAYLRMAIAGAWNDNNFRLMILSPLVLVLSFKVDKWIVVINGFILAAFIISILGLSNIFIYYFETGNIDMTSGAHINKLVILHRPFLGLILVTSTFLSLHLSGIYRKYKFYFYFLAVFFSSYIVLVSARIALLSLITICSLYIIFYLKTSVLKKISVFVLIVVAFGVVTVLTPSMSKRFGINKNLEIIQNNIKDIEPRITIWECGFRIFKNEDFNFLVGKGSREEIVTDLVSCYEMITDNISRRDYFVESRFHLHNQFLDIYGIFGIIGLSLFSTCFVLLIYYKRNYFTSTALILSVFLFCMVDNIYSTQTGVLLSAIICSFGINFKNKKDFMKNKSLRAD